jgi:hypothetical protein
VLRGRRLPPVLAPTLVPTTLPELSVTHAVGFGDDIVALVQPPRPTALKALRPRGKSLMPTVQPSLGPSPPPSTAVTLDMPLLTVAMLTGRHNGSTAEDPACATAGTAAAASVDDGCGADALDAAASNGVAANKTLSVALTTASSR